MRIGGFQTRLATDARARARAGTPARKSTSKPVSSRALVPVAPPAPTGSELPASPRPAAFLAHLVAMRDQAPQTRLRRRAEPAEAALIYRTSLTRMTAPSPARLSRTV